MSTTWRSRLWRTSGRQRITCTLLALSLALAGAAAVMAQDATLARAQALEAEAHRLRGAGDWVGAGAVLEQAAAIAERAGGRDHAEVGRILSQRGFVLNQLGRYVEARRDLERALQILQRTSGRDDFAAIKTSEYLADALEDAGEYGEARPLRERSVRFHERRGPDSPALADRLTRLAAVLHVIGAQAQARQAVDRAIRITEAHGSTSPPLGRALSVLADILESQGDHRGARPVRARALAIVERTYGANYPWTAEANNDLADLLFTLGEPAVARRHYERALDISRRLGVPGPRWRASLGLGGLHERRGRLVEAVTFYREAHATVEGLAGQFDEAPARARFLEAGKRLSVYDTLARALLKLHEREPGRGYEVEALAVLEAKRGRIAAEALAAARPTAADPQVRAAVADVRDKQDQALASERDLRQEQAKAPAQQNPRRVQDLTADAERRKKEFLASRDSLLARYPRLKAQFVDQQTVDPKLLAKFASRLPAGTMVVEYFAVPDVLYLFVAGAGGQLQVKTRAVTQPDLYALVDEYRRHLMSGASRALPWSDDGSETYRQEVTRFKRVTRELSEHLLGPVGAELDTSRNLILIPNDALLNLPIHALVRAAPGGAMHFLAETHTVSYMTQLESADVLSPGAAASLPPLLVMGNPDGTLRWASDEIRALRALRPQVLAYEGQEATKARLFSLVAQLHPDLHLATHGKFNDAQPERSYVLMSGTDDASRRLTIGEIPGLQIGDGLAVLSGCDTAIGQQVPGAALISLAAAFSLAGARSVVASLWLVSDEATRDFMVIFHSALATSGRAAALQAAQAALMSKPKTAHPYYWAPFVLIGGR